MKFLFPAVFLLVFSSCLTDPDCLRTSGSNVRIAFQTAAGKDSVVAFDSVWVSGTDSVFYKNTDLSLMSLPVNPASSTTRYYFFHDMAVDSLQVRYLAEHRIISPACGAFIYYNHLTIDAGTFSDATVVLNQLSTSHAANIEVAF